MASGLLTGKYRRSSDGGTGDGRLEAMKGSANPVFHKFTERNWRIVDALLEVARELGRPAAQVAVNWIARRPGVTSTLIGATTVAQLEDNLAALELDVPAALARKLEEVRRPELVSPYLFFSPEMQGMLSGGVPVHSEPPWYRGQ